MMLILLSAPDGRVYAYACGRRHYVAAGASLFGHHDVAGLHEQLVAMSRGEAERCCLCLDCGATRESDWVWSVCPSCDWRRRFAIMWLSIGACMPNGLTEEQWRERVWNDEDD